MFKVISLNARGLQNRKKRRSVYRWAKMNNCDILFLQETHSTEKIEHIWRNEWFGTVIYSHGNSSSKGTAICFRKKLDMENLEIIYKSVDGRAVILKVVIEEIKYVLINVYAPNVQNCQIQFYQNLKKIIERNVDTEDNIILVGGDFNVPLDDKLDKKGGIKERRQKVQRLIQEIMQSCNLIDTWRIKNPEVQRYTWRQKTENIKCRLDYWLLNQNLQDMVSHVDILTNIRSDHNAIELVIKPLRDNSKGKGYWKINNSILQDAEFIKLITEAKLNWSNEMKEIEDARVKWEFMKYKIRLLCIKYTSEKKKKQLDTEKILHTKMSNLQMKLDKGTDKDEEKIINLQIQQIETELEKIDDYKTQGLIVRSQVRWFEQGEKSNKYFLNLEKLNNTGKTIRKLKDENNIEVIDHKNILKICEKYYQDLYSSKIWKSSKEIENYLKLIDIPQLTKNENEKLIKPITKAECYNTIKTFSSGKCPGNDGLSIEFYKAFWPLFGSLIVESFNTSIEEGELSNSQRQAVITLLDKKKDRSLIKNWRPISLLNNDYKILSKVLSLRLIDILPRLINVNQTGYVKNRFIGENIRLIKDILEYTKKEDIPGVLIGLDFEKGFDSLEWPFMFQVLKKYNFPDFYIKAVKTLYKNITSTIINNGVTRGYFPVNRGVRQGDPLSPYLFVLSIEILGQIIRKSNKIKGIKVNNEEIKILQYLR